MSFIPVLSGDALPIKLQLGGRETGLFPQARVYNQATDVEQTGSPVSLTHTANGMYSGSLASLADAKYYVVCRVFTDAGHTVQSGVYPNSSTDNYEIKTLEAKDATVAKAATAVSNVDYTSSRATKIDNLDATISSRSTQTSVNTLTTTVGTPAGASVSADIASVKSDSSGLRTDYTTVRAAKIDNLDATVSSRATQTSVNAIPTNPLLTTDSRLNHLDADISTRASQTSVNTLTTTVGTPAGASVSADIAALQTTENTINTKIGTPASSVSADIAAVKTDTGNTLTKIGTPAGASIAADIAADKAVDDAISAKLGTPVGSTFSADIASVQTGVNTTNTRLGTPVGATFSADIAAVKADEVTLLGRLTPTRAANLDNLDVTVSSRESETDASSRAAADLAATAGVLAAVQGIQNNTSFVGVVPQILAVPGSGTTPYKFFANLFDTVGNPEDPDSNTINYKIEDTSGGTVVATTAMTRDGLGRYSSSYSVASTDPDLDLVFIFTYAEASVAFTQYRTSRVQSSSSDLDTLLARLTPTRASNLDNLDVLVSSRVAESDDLSRYNNILASEATTLTAVGAVSTKIGTPVAGSVTADIASVKVQTDKIGSPANVTLAADMAALQTTENTINTKIGTPVGVSLSADVAAVKTVVDATSTKIGTPAGASIAADIAADKAVDDAINAKIGTPAGVSVSADVAAVKSVVDTTSTKIGTPAGASIAADIAADKAVDDAINAKLGTPVSSVSADIAAVKSDTGAINTKLGTPVSTVSADIASVKSDSSGLRTDYTTLRAVKLDHLDADVTTRQSTSTAATQYGNLTSQIGVPVGASISADIAAVKADTTKIGTPAGASVSADVAAVKTVVDTITSRIGIPTTTLADEIGLIVSDVVVYEPHAVFSISADNKLQATMWLSLNNQILTAGLGVSSYQVYDASGAAVSGATVSGITADGNGMFICTPISAVNIIDLTHYTIKLTITTTSPVTSTTAWRGLSIGE